MPVPSSKLGLEKPTLADDFSTSTHANNLQIIDDHPGVFVCLSSERPTTWGSEQEGMFIFERDTALAWRWTGSAFVRQAPVGRRVTEARTADLSTTSVTTFDTLVSANVAVLPGGRRLEIVASWCRVGNTNGAAELGIFRDDTQLAAWPVRGIDGEDGVDGPSGGSFVFDDAPPALTSYAYSLRFRGVGGIGGTTWARASADRPIRISIKEV